MLISTGKHRTSRQRVAEQSEGVVTARQPLRHDAGTDDGGEQERGSESFREEFPAEHVQATSDCGNVDPSVRPISRSRAPSVIRSRLAIGRFTNSEMRFRK